MAHSPPPLGPAVNTAALSVSSDAGNPWAAADVRNVATTSAALNATAVASDATSSREWSSSMLQISVSSPPASVQWVMSACHRSLGWKASNRTKDDRGRFCGWGVTNPRRERIRQMVETAGEAPWRRVRWNAMVCAPASRPWVGQGLAELHDVVFDPGWDPLGA